MSDKIRVNVELVLDLPLPKDRRRPADARVTALARAIVAQALPSLASEAGLAKERLAGALLAELGYHVGSSLTPVAAMDALAVATERLRDGIVGRGGNGARLPVATVRGPRTLQ